VALSHASRERFQSLFRRLAAAKLQSWTVGFCGSQGGLPDSRLIYTPCYAHLREDDGHI
jgi:hypothetical protein